MKDYVAEIEERLLIERGAYTQEELRGAINARIDELVDEVFKWKLMRSM